MNAYHRVLIACPADSLESCDGDLTQKREDLLQVGRVCQNYASDSQLARHSKWSTPMWL